MSNSLANPTALQDSQHATEVLRLFQSKHRLYYVNGVEDTINQLASQTDVNYFNQAAVELLATLISLPESTKLGVKHGLNNWMTGILNGTISSTTVAPLLEILLQDINGKRRRVDSFDVWKSVNTHFGNSDKKIVFPFLDLPCELRLMIYINYFELDTQDPGKRLIDAYRSASRGENRLALMCTNHQIYYEARKVLYQDFTMKLNSACNLRLFFRSLRGYTYTIIRSLHIDGISVEHVNSLAYLLSGTGLMGVRFLTLVATPRYMGPASLEGHATRTRKRLIYPEFKYRLRMAVGKLFSRSEPSSHISPVLILEDFRRDQKYNAVFPDSWNVSASWKG